MATQGKFKEEIGCISIDELDPKGAETLAHFRMWIAEHFGSASAAFRELDRCNKKSVSQLEFLHVIVMGVACTASLLPACVGDGLGQLAFQRFIS